jgi:hypothetical protein
MEQRRWSAKFCCQAAQKMDYLTDPNAEPPISFCGTCAVCGRDEPYTYHVPESLWRKVVPERYWHEIVCAGCFDVMARQV